MRNGSRIGHSGRLNHDMVKPVAAFHQVAKNADQIASNRTTNAAVVHFEDLFFSSDYEVIINANLTEFVFDYRNSFAVIFGQNSI